MNGYEMEVTEVKIPVPWGHISGKWWGSMDIQPIVALHGRQDNAGSFDTLTPLLCTDLSVLCVDMPGHGLSSHYPKGLFYYLYWDGVILLRRIVKHYKWNKVKLLGHSLGGAICFMYAGIFPKEVEFLICLDIASPTVKTPSDLVKDSAGYIDKFLSYDVVSPSSAPSHGYNQVLSLLEDAYNGSISKESAEVLMKRGAQLSSVPDKYIFTRDPRLKVSMLGSVSMDMVLEYASRIECPYLNIRARHGMSDLWLETYKTVVNKIEQKSRKFKYHEVEGTHHVHLNEPQKVAPLIRDFLFS